ncbi:hypothetical protein MK805_00930 [Shimazuella sp. AN120528]|nr:hypothetical protein [Shimazuella soli]MCH5583535.1 hypothetical protein [Shimazuella soli]
MRQENRPLVARKLELVDVQQERLEGNLVQIIGKSYDIFAVPVRVEEEG